MDVTQMLMCERTALGHKKIQRTDDTPFCLGKPIVLTLTCKLHSFHPSLNMSWIYKMTHSLCTEALHMTAVRKRLD